MAYVVPLEGYQPSARDDDLPWVGARVYEAADAAGPFTSLIDTFEFATDTRVTPTGLDPDPAAPRERAFTTAAATLPAGWYLVVFFDAAGSTEPTSPVFHGGPVVPSSRQVARFIRARTLVNGAEVGDFTTATNPTADQVEEYVQNAAGDVIAEVGRVIPAGAQDLARYVIAIGAALLIEANSEEINEARYDRLKALYDERLARLNAAVEDVEAGGEPGSEAGAGVLPLGLFPAATRLDW
ncbi:MAG TPA: hypothetical protein VN213_06690 [Solirubrobacteraceae bacterium]|nr:hypothetical protein [Solirubrobacteraceae bacterium]